MSTTDPDIQEFLDGLEEDSLPADLTSSPEDAQVGDGKLSSKSRPRTADMVASVWRVYHQLGGDAWLLSQAKAYPKEFLQIVKQMLPKDVEDKTPPNIALIVHQADGNQVRGSSEPIRIIEHDEEPAENHAPNLEISYKH